MTRPAANAPRTKSKSSLSARRTRIARRATDRRTASCPLLFTVSRAIVMIRGGRKWTAIPAAPATTRPKPMSRTMLAVVACAPVRKSEMTTIGQNSPATAAPSVFWPSGEGRTPASDRIGESSERGRGQGDSEQPSGRRDSRGLEPEARRGPDRDRKPQPSDPRARSRRGTPLWITSMPARKKRKTRAAERNSMYASLLAMSSTSGPIRIPRKISTTTVGRISLVLTCETIVATAATQNTSASETRSGAEPRRSVALGRRRRSIMFVYSPG